jgi:hypothetical protein
LVLTLTLAAPAVLAADAAARATGVPAHSPEWTNPKGGDPGAAAPSPGRAQSATPRPADSRMEELQKIVVLCATQPESATLAQAWGAHVKKYYERDAELDRAIDNVLNRASAERQRRHSASGQLTWTAAERRQARSFLYSTARAAFSQAR